MPRLKLVARGVLGGLALLEEAGIVHNAARLIQLSRFVSSPCCGGFQDLKPDNIVWVEAQDAL